MLLIKFFMSYVLFIYLQFFVSSLTPILDLIAPRINTRAFIDNSINTLSLVKSFGFTLENYKVVTEDGYLLTLNHLIHPNITSTPNELVLFQHGVLSSSDTWLLKGPNHDLAYILSSHGYDIWLNNCRGNIYSRNHKYLKTSDPRFWTFSFHEIGYYDLAAVIDFILKKTRRKSLNYIGHSMGSTALCVLLSSRPEYNKKIHLGILMAPVVYFRTPGNPMLRTALLLAPKIVRLLKLDYRYEFLPREKFRTNILKLFCKRNQHTAKMCKEIYFLAFGVGNTHFNQSFLDKILSYYPSGASLDTFLHYVQNMNSGQFRYMNFGLKGNYRRYKQTQPPNYNITQINAPLALYYAMNDILAVPKDVEYLGSKLKNLRGVYRVSHNDFNHGDFIWGENIAAILYNHIINLLKKS